MPAAFFISGGENDCACSAYLQKNFVQTRLTKRKYKLQSQHKPCNNEPFAADFAQNVIDMLRESCYCIYESDCVNPRFRNASFIDGSDCPLKSRFWVQAPWDPC